MRTLTAAVAAAVLGGAGLLLAGVAYAATLDTDRPFCADRPGLDTPTCTLPPGTLMLEIGSLDLVSSNDNELRVEVLTVADVRMRLGIGEATELQLDVPAYRSAHVHDRASGARRHGSGAGDITVAARHNFLHPEGSGTAVAAMPWVSLPTGTGPASAGTYAAGLSVPIMVEVADGLSLGLTPEFDYVGDDAGGGHHVAFGTVVGVGASLSDSVGFALELSAMRNDDPAAASTQYLAGLSAGWQAAKDIQLDAGINLGLSRSAPDTEFYTGLALRF